MEENNQNFVAPATPQSKHSYWKSIIAVVFVVALVGTILSPVGLSGVAFTITLLAAVGTVISTISSIMTSVQHQGPVAKTFAFIGALFILVVITIITLFAGLVANLKAHPIEGD